MCCGLSHEERRARLIEEHGQPRRHDAGGALRLLGCRAAVHPRDVIASAYQDQAAAAAWAESNLAHYGHPSLGAVTVEGVGVVGVLDLRPALAAHGVPPTDPARPDGWLPPVVMVVRPPGGG
jgi:hypothetical protein